MVFSTWTITERSYLNFLDNNNLTPDEDYFLRLRFHHRNLLALSWEEKAALAPSYEGQLVPLANHIVQLRRRPEFTAINQTADRLLRLQEEVVRDLQVAEARIGRLSSSQAFSSPFLLLTSSIREFFLHWMVTNSRWEE